MKQRNYQKGALKILGLFIFLSFFLINFASAKTCDLNVSLVNQDPYPAVPGDYVDVVFQVSGIDSLDCGGAKFKLIPSYPFSIDENDTNRVLEGNTFGSGYKKEWMIPYKLRVNKDALDGDSKITIASGQKINYEQEDVFVFRDFYITIQDSRTDFDSVIQEVSGSEISIAIANIGEYTANSVVVRIPEQDNFKATGISGQMVGNLDAGDYTIVSFSLNPIIQKRTQSDEDSEKTDFKNKNLQFDIYYTDTLGERRIVNMNLPLQMNSGALTNGEEQSGTFQKRINVEQNSKTNWNLWIAIGVIIILVIILYIKFQKIIKRLTQKIKKLFNKKKQLNNISNVIPDWMNNDKDGEKKK